MAKQDDKSAGNDSSQKPGTAPPARKPAPTPGKPRSAEDLLARLIPVFRAEADERLQAVEKNLILLEKGAAGEERQKLIETVMRDAHSIKGGARTVNLKHVEGICQNFESVTAKMRDGELGLSAGVFNVLHGTVDLITAMLERPDAIDQPRLDRLMEQLTALEHGNLPEEPKPAAVVPPPKAPVAPARPAVPHTPKAPVSIPTAPPVQPVPLAAQRQESVRVSLEKLDDLFRQAQEMLAVKLTTTQRCADLRELGSQVELWRRQWSKVDTSVRRLQAWVEANHYSSNSPLSVASRRVIEFLEWTATHMRGLDGRVKGLARTADQDRLNLSLMVDLLLDDTRKVLMMPCATLFAPLPRMVRDLAQTGGKTIEFGESGGDIEIDKRIVDEIKDALVHLVRNCIDHGVESPADRQAAGKPASASVHVGVRRLANEKIELTVSDDGRGIDAGRVIEVARRSGMISEAESRELTHDDVIQLIFRSGLSTSPTVTRISGRGLGMPIVRERVEKLGGRIQVDSIPGHGTTFRIELPLTLATLRGILLRTAGQMVVVPTLNVERVTRVRRDEVQDSGEHQVVVLGEEAVPIVPLESVLGLRSRSSSGEGDYLLLLVIAAAGRRVAFVIDEVESEQEVLFKALGGYLARVRNVAGATVLGTGRVVPILNASDLVQSAFDAFEGVERFVEVEREEEEVIKHILVAEDSITSRMLLKEILESAGYLVTTAVDGADALAHLDDREVDLVVSDVEMPRLDGFGLAQKIRGNPRYAHVPVILVTGLEKDADRERGRAAGASAYIVKSSFDQSDLLKAIEGFI